MSESNPKRISQTLIAQELGFSQALVSMALNNRKKGISESAYNTIWEFALENGYAPRGMNIETARKTVSVTTIGYILRSPLKLANKSNFFGHIHQGLYEYLETQDIKTVFLGSEDDLSAKKKAISKLPESVKGIALMGEVKTDFFERIRSFGKPIAYISARATGKSHSILSNESESAEIIVNHLYEQGHREFAWLGGNQRMGRFRDRLEGLKDALTARRLQLNESYSLGRIGADRKEGFQLAEELLDNAKANSSFPTAWVCLNGLVARGAINCLFQKGIGVGSEVSIAAFDMTNVCQEEHPTVTCAGANPEEMGAEAGKVLISAIEGESKALSDITIPPSFIAGKSSGPMVTKIA